MNLLEDPYKAYCFDQAIAYIGNKIQGELDAVEGKTSAEVDRKRQGIMDRYFPPTESEVKTRFADPMQYLA